MTGTDKNPNEMNKNENKNETMQGEQGQSGQFDKNREQGQSGQREQGNPQNEREKSAIGGGETAKKSGESEKSRSEPTSR